MVETNDGDRSSPAYDASSIVVLSPGEHMRKRPGMYLGDVRSGDGLVELAMQAVRHAFDQHLAGRVSHIAVTVHADDSVTVADDGLGWPPRALDLHLVECRHLRSEHERGGFFHLGLINHLSERLILTSVHEGQGYRREFRAGVPDEPTHSDTSRRRGTRMRFWPDRRVFRPLYWNLEGLRRSIETLALLRPGLRTTFEVETREVPQDGGLAALFERWFPSAALGTGPVLIDETFGLEHDPARVRVGLGWEHGVAAWMKARIESYCGYQATPAGGVHVDGLRKGVRAGLRRFVDAEELEVSTPALETAAEAGLSAVIVVEHPSACDGSGIRAELRSDDVEDPVSCIVERELSAYLSRTRERSRAWLVEHESQFRSAQAAAAESKYY